jgi:hypothetical protein
MPIEDVHNDEERVIKNHAGTGEPHHFPNRFPHFRLKAVGWTLNTSRFFRFIPALKKPLASIFPKFIACGTKALSRVVMAFAIELYKIFTGF